MERILYTHILYGTSIPRDQVQGGRGGILQSGVRGYRNQTHLSLSEGRVSTITGKLKLE